MLAARFFRGWCCCFFILFLFIVSLVIVCIILLIRGGQDAKRWEEETSLDHKVRFMLLPQKERGERGVSHSSFLLGSRRFGFGWFFGLGIVASLGKRGSGIYCGAYWSLSLDELLRYPLVKHHFDLRGCWEGFVFVLGAA